MHLSGDELYRYYRYRYRLYIDYSYLYNCLGYLHVLLNTNSIVGCLFTVVEYLILLNEDIDTQKNVLGSQETVTIHELLSLRQPN